MIIMKIILNKGKIAIATLITASAVLVSACERDAQVASRNLSKAADMFEIDRQIVFYNGITNDYMLTIEGKCSIEDQSNQLEVTCKTGPEKFSKHFLGLSDNVTYFAQQVEDANVSEYHHRIVFKPQSIVPDMDVRASGQEMTTDRY